MSYCNERIPFADVVELRRLYDEGFYSVRELSERFKIHYRYCWELLQGCARQSADARRPILGPPRAAREFLRDPHGSLFIRRGKSRRFAKQIPYDTIWKIRHEHEMNGTPPSDLAVLFGVSLSTIRRVLKKQSRVTS